MILQDSVIYHTRAHGDRPPWAARSPAGRRFTYYIVLSSHARNAIADACLERRPTEICPLGKAQVWVKFFWRLHYLSRDAINYRGGVHIRHLAGSFHKYKIIVPGRMNAKFEQPLSELFLAVTWALIWNKENLIRNLFLEESIISCARMLIF